MAQNNSCQWAFDGDCDEARYGGTGACPAGTDTADCSAPSGPNSCQFAFDGECDRSNFGGTGACPSGTDTADCSAPSGPNSCQWAYDGECDESRYGGTGVCSSGTDTADCAPRSGGRGSPNSCQYAFDGECDEPGIGTGFCASGTDTADCRGVSAPSDMVYQIQVRLQRMGYNPGPADGQIGPNTRRAIMQFQRDLGLPVTGQASYEMLQRMP